MVWTARTITESVQSAQIQGYRGKSGQLKAITQLIQSTNLLVSVAKIQLLCQPKSSWDPRAKIQALGGIQEEKSTPASAAARSEPTRIQLLDCRPQTAKNLLKADTTDFRNRQGL